MPVFHYVAKDRSGKTVRGSFDSSSKEEVVHLIRERSFIPLEIYQVKERFGGDIDLSKYKKVKTRDIAIFCRQFATTIRAGLTIIDSIDIISKQFPNKKLAEVLNQVSENVQRGYTLSSAMAEHPKEFPLLLVNMIESGEISGNLDVVLDNMAAHYEKEHKLLQKVKSAVTYPIIVSIIAVLVVVFLLTFVMPTFINMFNSMGADLPAITKIMLAISDSLKRFYYIYIIALVLIIYMLKKYISTPQGKYKFDRLKLKVMIFGQLNTKVILSRFSRTMSILLNSGVDILQAIDIVTKVVNNNYISKELNEVQQNVGKGMGMGKSLEKSGAFPPMLYQMIDIGENTGSLDFVLEKVAVFYDSEVETAVDQLTTMIEPIIIVVLGVIVCSIIASMVLPMFDMYSIIG